MKKGLVIVGECLLLIFVLALIKFILSKCFPEIDGNIVLSFVMYFFSGFGTVLIYRFNTRKKS